MYSVHAGFMDFHTDYKFREYRKNTQMCIYTICVYFYRQLKTNSYMLTTCTIASMIFFWSYQWVSIHNFINIGFSVTTYVKTLIYELILDDG